MKILSSNKVSFTIPIARFFLSSSHIKVFRYCGIYYYVACQRVPTIFNCIPYTINDLGKEFKSMTTTSSSSNFLFALPRSKTNLLKQSKFCSEFFAGSTLKPKNCSSNRSFWEKILPNIVHLTSSTWLVLLYNC